MLFRSTMGSVIDQIECPHCKQEAFIDFYYKTGEEYTTCSNCGYHKSITIKDRDKEYSSDNIEVVEISNPYGAYRLKTYHGVAYQCGSLENETEYSELKKYLEDDMEIEFCSISRLIDGKIVTEILIDNGPETDSAGFTTNDN